MAFCVSVSDAATYWFDEGVSAEEAKRRAWDFFHEREPMFEVEEYNPEEE